MIVDRLGRKFRNLRVSLTAACNYACTYCVPDGKRLMKAHNELPAPKLLKAVKLLQQATGIDKVRITGGEPLVTPKFDDFLLGVMSMGLRDVSMTTNGQLLMSKKDVIAESGLKRMNISLDTLNPLRFKQIARGGDLETVLKGIDAMLELRHQAKDKYGADAIPKPLRYSFHARFLFRARYRAALHRTNEDGASSRE